MIRRNDVADFTQSELENFAARLAETAEAGDVFALYGTLGAGKTVFSRAFIRALTDPDEEVPSPTFTLVQLYDADKATIWHFDLYRLKSADEIYELGFEEALGDGISLIEWPERAGALLPKNRLDIRIETGDAPDRRRISIVPHGKKWIDKTENTAWLKETTC